MAAGAPHRTTESATTRSRFPSPFKSAIRTCLGDGPRRLRVGAPNTAADALLTHTTTATHARSVASSAVARDITSRLLDESSVVRPHINRLMTMQILHRDHTTMH